VKITLPYGKQGRVIEDLEDLRFWIFDMRVKHFGTLERQVALGFVFLFGISIAAGAYIYLNRTPVKVEARNDQEAGF
tara:strand:- start:399 stop:629 length:231 start_codon:yes stop_codon:yes gene_type:complete